MTAPAAVPRVRDWAGDPERQEAHRKAIELFGHVSDLFAVMGHAPTVLSGWIDLVRRLRTDLAVDPVLHELLVVRVAQLAGGSYVEVAHRRLAERLGLGAERLASIATWQSAPCFDPTERAVLELAERMAAATATPTDTTALIDRVGERAAVELVVVAGFYCGVARIAGALGVHPREQG